MPLGGRHGVCNTQLGQAAVKACHVLVKTKQLAGVGGHHLVHAIAKNKAAVKHADLGVFKRGVVAIEVTKRLGQGVGHIYGRCWSGKA